MSNGFDPDNRFTSGFTKVADTLVLSIPWLVMLAAVLLT